MLVLTRKSEEQIVIGKKNEIVITILKIQGDKVSIGIVAPEDQPIMRKELLLRNPEKNHDRNQDKEVLLQLQNVANNKENKSNLLPQTSPESKK